MDRVALDFGIIQVYWYSIFIFIGILAGSIAIYFESKRRKIDQEFMVNLVFNAIIFGIIGARLYYVLFNLDYYKQNPIEILEIWNGGLAIHGGLIAGCLTVIYQCRKNRINTLKIFDIIVVGLIFGQAVGRWGNFFNQEAYGAVTTAANLQSMGIPKFVIDGMFILGEYRQPTFFFESMWNLFGFIALLIIKRYPYLKLGQLSGFYLVWYSSARFIIEGMRVDSLMFHNMKVAQVTSVIMIIIGIFLFIYYKYIKRVGNFSEYLYNYDEPEKKEEHPLFVKETEL